MSSGQFSDLLMDAVPEKQEPIKPLWKVEGSEDTSKWIKSTFIVLMKRYSRYFEEVRENLKMYKGEVFDKQKTSANSRLTTESSIDPLLEKARNAKLYDNKIYDLVEWRVTTHNSDKPGIDISPANTDFKDRIGAQIAKAVSDTIWYNQDEDEKERNTLRNAFICGEHYQGVLWDPDSGDIHPDFKKLVDKKKKSKNEDESVEIAGKKYSKDNPINIGDVIYKHFPAWKVLPEPVDSWDKVEWLMTWDVDYADCVKKEYPQFKDLIQPSGERTSLEGFDEEYLRRLRDEGKVVIIEIFAKRSKYLKKGRYIKATTDGQILEDMDSPYSHDRLPLVRLTDMDIPGELRGRSFLRNIKALQYQQFFLTSMVAANIRLMGYPKWVIDQGSVNVSDLTNARNVIQKRTGAADPRILQPQPTPPEVFKQIADLEAKMDQRVKGQFSSSQDLPARVDSALALQYLDEKDLKRNHTMFAKVNAFRVTQTELSLMVAGQFYDVNDKRLLKIAGENHAYDIKYFDFVDFNRPYDVRVKPGSALPEQKSARIQAILEVNKEAPGLYDNKQLADMLQLGDIDKFYDVATKSLKAAESIVQDLLTGNKVPPPEGFEDLITYWKTFATYIQDRQFKESVPPEIKQQVLDYLNAIEGLMAVKALKNPIFAQQLQQDPALALYPLIFVLPQPTVGAQNVSFTPEQQITDAAAPAPQQPQGINPVHGAAAAAHASVSPQDLVKG